jgi:hypothetical protein
MKTTQDAPPPYTPSGQQQITSADFQVNLGSIFLIGSFGV